jgi:hypothetical protein
MDLMPEPPRCAYPGCPEWGAHNHHITYDPEVKKWLCVRHHEEITILNGQQGRKYRRGLSNKHRWWIWYQWTQGKLKVRRTRKSLEWVEEWQAGAPGRPAEAQTLGEPVGTEAKESPARPVSKEPMARPERKTLKTRRGKRRKALARKRTDKRSRKRKHRTGKSKRR